MSETVKHTAGPWAVGTNKDFPNHIEAADPFMRGGLNLVKVAEAFPIGGEDDDQHVANAHLIAAAPDLLEALKWVRLNYASGPTAEINARIDAALAKAGA